MPTFQKNPQKSRSREQRLLNLFKQLKPFHRIKTTINFANWTDFCFHSVSVFLIETIQSQKRN